MPGVVQGNQQYERERRLVASASDLAWVDRYEGWVLREAEREAYGRRPQRVGESDLMQELTRQVLLVKSKVEKK